MASIKDHTATVLSAIRKKFGEGAAGTLDKGSKSTVSEVIPSGIEAVDRHVLGCAGLPVGRMIEVYSEEGSGKTSLMLSGLAGATAGDGVVLLAEPELSLQSERPDVFGVDRKRVILINGETVEEILEQAIFAIESIPKSAGPSFFAWDSIAATLLNSQLYGKLKKGKDGKKAADEDARGAGVGEAGRVMSDKIKLLCKVAHEHRCHVFLVNQVRDKIGVMFGPTQGTPGGHAIKFHASARLQLFKGKGVKVNDQHVGTTITVFATKNKIAMPLRKARCRLDYRYGWDNNWTTLELAKTLKLIPKAAKGTKALVTAREALKWPALEVTKDVEQKLEEAESLDHGSDPLDEMEDDLDTAEAAEAGEAGEE